MAENRAHRRSEHARKRGARLQGQFLRRLFTRVSLLVLIGMIVVSVITWEIMQRWMHQFTDDQLHKNVRLAQRVVTHEWPFKSVAAMQKECREFEKETGLRLTIIDTDGVVLADSDANPAHMENHRDRPEVKAALAGRIGQDTRNSASVNHPFVYVALPMVVNGKTGAVVRVAAPEEDIQRREAALIQWVGIGLAVSVPMALIIAWFLSRAIAAPVQRVSHWAERLATGDLDTRVELRGFDEVGHLAESLERMRKNLAARIREVQQAAAMKTDFVANASHELRTPVATIRAAAETLASDGLDEETRRRFTSVIQKNIERLQNLTEDLMNLNLVESASPELNVVQFELAELISSLRASFADTIDQKGASFAFSSNVDLVTTDRRWLEIILKNLLDNALKFISRGGEVSIHCYETVGKLRFEVRDDGCGIPESDLERVFERFYQVDKSRGLNVGGTGLGLAIVKHAVYTLGGEISIASKVGGGTTVSFWLPVAAAAGGRHADEEQRERSAARERTSFAAT